MQGNHLRKYGVATTIDFELFEVDGIDFRIDAADGGADCTIRKNQGADATCTNDFADEGLGYSLLLSATEMQAAVITLYIVDATATKVWLDKAIHIETYGNASAQHAFDLDLPGVTIAAMNSNVIDAASIAAGALDGKGDWNVDKTGYSVSVIGSNVIDAASINAGAMDGKGDWNVGKGGYSLATDGVSAAALAAAAIDKIRDGLLPTQNAAFNNLEFLFVAASDHATPVTGAGGMAVTRSIDGGSFGAGTGTGPAEVGNGIYQYDASAADMNGGIITFRFTATSGTPGAPDDRFVTIVTGGGV